MAQQLRNVQIHNEQGQAIGLNGVYTFTVKECYLLHRVLKSTHPDMEYQFVPVGEMPQVNPEAISID